MSIREEYAWAAFCEQGSPYPFIHSGVVRTYAKEVRADMGMAWAHDGESVKRGWERAHRNGWRVIRVRISAAFVDREPPQ